jgi:signal transduction histidine kinase
MLTIFDNFEIEWLPRLLTRLGTKPGSCTGPGLRKSKSIVKAYCGTIWTESNKNSRRATSTFALPLLLTVAKKVKKLLPNPFLSRLKFEQMLG